MIDLSSSLVDGFQEPKAQGFMDLKGALDDLAGELLVFHLEEKTKDKGIFGTGPIRPDTRMGTDTACHFSRNRVLDFLRPANAGGAVFQGTDDGDRNPGSDLWKL